MSMQNVISFGNAVGTDQAMQAELTAAVGGAKGRDAYAKTAEFATAKGYEVTTDEVAMGYEALQKGDSEELNDAELEVVSGGKGGKQAGQQVRHDYNSAINNAGNQVAGFFKGLLG